MFSRSYTFCGCLAWTAYLSSPQSGLMMLSSGECDASATKRSSRLMSANFSPIRCYFHPAINFKYVPPATVTHPPKKGLRSISMLHGRDSVFIFIVSKSTLLFSRTHHFLLLDQSLNWLAFSDLWVFFSLFMKLNFSLQSQCHLGVMHKGSQEWKNSSTIYIQTLVSVTQSTGVLPSVQPQTVRGNLSVYVCKLLIRATNFQLSLWLLKNTHNVWWHIASPKQYI